MFLKAKIYNKIIFLKKKKKFKIYNKVNLIY